MLTRSMILLSNEAGHTTSRKRSLDQIIQALYIRSRTDPNSDFSRWLAADPVYEYTLINGVSMRRKRSR